MLNRLKRKVKRQGATALKSIVQTRIYDNLALEYPAVFSPSLKRAFIEITSFCNLNCAYCLRDKGPDGYMSPVLFRKVMDELASLHVGYVGLNYSGESLLHPQFKELLTYAMAKKRNISSIGWISNGMLFGEEIADLVLDLGVGWITFSLDGLGMVNDKIRKGAKYSVIERNILRLLNKRGNRLKPHISISLTRTTQTAEDIGEFLNFWIGKVDQIGESPCHDGNLKITGLGYFEESNISGYCDLPFGTMGILWNGNVVPCDFNFDERNLMGNVSQSSVKSVWLGEKYRRLRLFCLRNSFQPNDYCYSCDIWRYCPKQTRDMTK